MVGFHRQDGTNQNIFAINKTHVQIVLLLLLGSGYGTAQYLLAKKRGEQWVEHISLQTPLIAVGLSGAILLLTSETFPRIAVAGSLSIFALLVLLTTKQTRELFDKIGRLSTPELDKYWNGYKVGGK